MWTKGFAVCLTMSPYSFHGQIFFLSIFFLNFIFLFWGEVARAEGKYKEMRNEWNWKFIFFKFPLAFTPKEFPFQCEGEANGTGFGFWVANPGP